MSAIFHPDAPRRRLLPLLLGLLLPLAAFAQDAPTAAPVAAPGADVASVRAWLLAHSPELRALQADTEAAQAQVISAGALPNPSVGVSLRGISPRQPSLAPAKVGSSSYTLRQSIPLWGKRGLARGVAEHGALALDAGRRATALQLLAQAEAAYVRYWHAGQALALLQAQRVLLQKIEEIAGVRYALGMAPQQDAIRAQVESSRVQGLQIAQEDAGREAGMTLNLLLGRRPDAALQTPADAPRLPVASASLDEALAKLDKCGHPALQAAKEQLAAASDSLRLRQRERWPDVSVGIGAMQSGHRIESYELMLEVELPLQRRAIAAREREARLRQDAAQPGRWQRGEPSAA